MKIEINTDNFTVSKTVLIGLLAVFVIFSAANAFLLNDVSGKITGKILAAKELARPANLEVVELTPTGCSDCFDAKNLLADLKKQNVNITSESSLSSDSVEAKYFIETFGIETLPALVITGEINKSGALENFFKSNGKIDSGTAVYTKVLPPFLDLKENKVMGRVKVVQITDAGCSKCADFSSFVDYLSHNGVSIVENKKVEWDSAEGKELAKKFNITKAPAVLVSDEIKAYKEVAPVFSQLKSQETNGFFATEMFKAPYREISSGKILGLAELILLTDKSGSECYDVSVNKNILARFGIAFAEEKTIDVSSDEGKTLIEKYKIKKAPIIIISPEGKLYSDFTAAWDGVGSTESDGWYIMRTPEIIGPVKDLETGKIFMPEQQSGGNKGIHWHPKLSIFISGKKQEIPANIGIGSQYANSPFYDSMMSMANMHTHDNSGELHWEVMMHAPTEKDLYLGNFFQVWGKTFNKNCIFEFCNAGGKSVKMFVNGKENSDFEKYIIKDGDDIQIKYE